MRIDSIHNASTAYYHLKSPCDVSKCDFQIKVTLRRVTGNPKKDPTIEKIIRWQKQDTPNHNVHSRFKGSTIDLDEQPRINLNPWSRIGEISMNNAKLKDRVDHKSTINNQHLHGMVIYTFVDRDYFYPTKEHSQTENQFPTTHISDGVDALPCHNLHTKETLHPTTAGRIHERLSREDPIQCMSIVAAVDLDMKIDEIALDTHGKSKPLGYEKVLCVLRLHQSGILEVRPDFSKRQLVERVHDSNLFVNEDSLNFWRKYGVPITTYSFRSASGIQYQYCIELLYDSLDLHDTQNDIDRHFVVSRPRRATWLEKINHTTKPSEINSDESLTLLMLMEICTARNFILKSTHFSSWRESTLSIHFHVMLDYTSERGEHNIEPGDKLLLSGQSQYSKSSQSNCMYPPLWLYGPNLLFVILFLEMVFVLKINWLVLLSAIMIAFLLTNLTTRLDYYSGGESIERKMAMYHFGYLDDFALPAFHIPIPGPILFIQVVNKTRFFERVVGIGFITLPTIPGRYELDILTIKPVGHRYGDLFQAALNDYYFGLPKLDVRSLMSMYKSTTDQSNTLVQSSGSVHIRMDVINPWQSNRDILK